MVAAKVTLFTRLIIYEVHIHISGINYLELRKIYIFLKNYIENCVKNFLT